jgi:argininosuccinate lyase
MMLSFSESLSYDQRLYTYDIAGSVAHVTMLEKQGILTEAEAAALRAGLLSVRADFDRGDIPSDKALEDIHTAVESALRSKVGDLAGKVHTARSRNDQVALDMHLWCIDAAAELRGAVRLLQRALLDQATSHKTQVMPGYTHLQRAQPVLLAHHLLAYFFMLERDSRRFAGVSSSAAVSPLGAAALAGSTFPLDPAFTAGQLGLPAVYDNSMDAVSDRDFLLELCFACSAAMVHLSRLSEEVVLWTTPEFGYASLSDAVTTGSSIMPQKKNADCAELIRGKAGRVFGRHMGLLCTIKGLPMAYCRDLQEDKEAAFECFDVTLACLHMAAQMVAALTWRAEDLAEAAESWPLMATDVADFLARSGVPFRDAHRVVGSLVRFCTESGRAPAELTAGELAAISALLTPAVCAELFDARHAVGQRDHRMATGPGSVNEQLTKAAQILEAE